MISSSVVRAVVVSVSAVILLALAPSSANALFAQCPPVGADAGCQFLITLTNGAPSVQQDATQAPYEGADDSGVLIP